MSHPSTTPTAICSQSPPLVVVAFMGTGILACLSAPDAINSCFHLQSCLPKSSVLVDRFSSQSSCIAFYKRFIESPNFSSWFERRRQAAWAWQVRAQHTKRSAGAPLHVLNASP